MKLFCAFFALFLAGNEIRYFPSVLYGQILVGTSTSKYETTFTVVAQRGGRAALRLFNDKGDPMNASFEDEMGNSAGTGASFELFLTPQRPVKIKLRLMPDQTSEDVAVMSGWATFESSEELDVIAVVQITTPEGKLIKRHVLESEKPPEG